MSYRKKIMTATLPVLKENAITGIGMGGTNFSRHIANNYEFNVSAPPHSHNVYTQIWVELGILGIFSFVLIVISNILRLLSVVNIFNNEMRNIGIALICSIIGMCIMGFLDYVLFYPRIMILFFVVISLSLCVTSIGKNTRKEIKNE